MNNRVRILIKRSPSLANAWNETCILRSRIVLWDSNFMCNSVMYSAMLAKGKEKKEGKDNKRWG